LLGSPINPFDRPAVDQTRTTERFDVTLKWRSDLPFTFNGVTIPPDESMPTLLEALRDQLGIKVESTTGKVSTLIIEHIEEPSPNQGLGQVLTSRATVCAFSHSGNMRWRNIDAVGRPRSVDNKAALIVCWGREPDFRPWPLSIAVGGCRE
ncbi:MAG TPA: TIGR03435 family protein, partial [Terracidiphilus sp.]